MTDLHWKHILTVAAATVVTMYAIRYLRASNSTIASIYPQPTGVTA